MKFVKIADREGKTDLYEIFKDEEEDICFGTIYFNPMYGKIIYEPVDEDPCGLELKEMIEIINFGLKLILKMQNIDIKGFQFYLSS